MVFFRHAFAFCLLTPVLWIPFSALSLSVADARQEQQNRVTLQSKYNVDLLTSVICNRCGSKVDGDFPSAFHTAAPDSHVPSIWHSMQQQLSESQPQMPSKPSHPSPYATLPKRQVQSHLEMRLFLAATNCVVGGCDVTEACKPAREAHNFSKPYLCRDSMKRDGSRC